MQRLSPPLAPLDGCHRLEGVLSVLNSGKNVAFCLLRNKSILKEQLAVTLAV